MNPPVAPLAVLFLCLTLSAARSTPLPSPPYQPPAFTESHGERATRVRALAPEIEALFREHAVSNHVPGLAYGVVVDGSLVISGAHGYANLEKQIPATPKSVFRIASMTKSFTAMAILRLRDRGKVDLEAPASRYLPELRKLPLLTRDAPSITLRHLLTHGAGFPEDNPWGDRQLADTDHDLVDLIRSPAQFSNPPGLAYEYSNLGFALLGRTVQQMSGRSCQTYITREILRPLGMASTYWEPDRVPADLLARGYRWEEQVWKPEIPLGDGSYAPMGGMLSTVEDFAKYMALHLSAWPPRNDPEDAILRRSSLREMHHPWRISGHSIAAKDGEGQPCPQVTAYAYGLAWGRDCRDLVRIGHSGGLPGYGSNWRIHPELGVGIVALGNVTYAGFSGINGKVLDRVVQRAGLKPRPLPASEILQSRAEALVHLLPDWDRAEESGIFAENFFPDNPPALLRRKTRALFSKAGTIQSVEAIRPENQLRGTLLLRGSQATLEVFFTLTPENPPLIQEVRIREAEVPAP